MQNADADVNFSLYFFENIFFHLQVSNYGGSSNNPASQTSMASLALQQQRLLTRPPAVSQAGARIRGQLPPGIQAQVPIQLENLPQFRLNTPQGLSQNFQVCYTVKQNKK